MSVQRLTVLHFCLSGSPRGWGDGVVGVNSLYKTYRFVPPQRIWNLGQKTGKDSHFGQESGMVFGGTTGVYERTYRFSPK